MAAPLAAEVLLGAQRVGAWLASAALDSVYIPVRKGEHL